MNSKKEKNFLPKVKLYRGKSFENSDSRRDILGVVGKINFPIQINQIKLIKIKKFSLNKKIPVGNHAHYGKSGQWEIICVLGKGSKKIARFRYRNYNNKKINETLLKAGDIAMVPPGCSLAILPMVENLQVIEISNKEYSKKNYIKDKLF